MIKIPKILKGKERKEAVVKTRQANINFEREANKDGLISVTVPSSWFEDGACRVDGLGNMLEQENFDILIPKERIDIINGFMYEGIMELERMKEGVKD